MNNNILLTTFKVSALALAVAGLAACSSSGSSSGSTSSASSSSSSSSPVVVTSTVDEDGNIITSVNEGAYTEDGFDLGDVTSYAHPDFRISDSDSTPVVGRSSVEFLDSDGDTLKLIVDFDGELREFELSYDEEEDYFVSSDNTAELIVITSDSLMEERGLELFNYMQLGFWVTFDEPFDGEGVPDQYDLGFFATGADTLASDMPTAGSFTYTGFYDGLAIGANDVDDIWGNATFTADFGSRDVSLELDPTVSDEGTFTFSGANFSGTIAEGTNTFSSASDDMIGRFFGPNAIEAGGTWAVNQETATYIGVFGVANPVSND